MRSWGAASSTVARSQYLRRWFAIWSKSDSASRRTFQPSGLSLRSRVWSWFFHCRVGREVLVCGWSKPHLWPRHLEVSQLFLGAPKSQPELFWGCWEHLNVWPVWKITFVQRLNACHHWVISTKWVLWTFVTAEVVWMPFCSQQLTWSTWVWESCQQLIEQILKPYQGAFLSHPFLSSRLYNHMISLNHQKCQAVRSVNLSSKHH